MHSCHSHMHNGNGSSTSWLIGIRTLFYNTSIIQRDYIALEKSRLQWWLSTSCNERSNTLRKMRSAEKINAVQKNYIHTA